MIGFGRNDDNGISSLDMDPMAMPITDRKSFAPPLPLGSDSAAQIASSEQQRQRLSDLNMVLVDQNNNYSQHETFTVRAKIMAHPLFPRLLQAYMNCQKIGAPPEVVARLDEAYAKSESSNMAAAVRKGTASIGEDPALDQFMEAYCEMLIKYEQELSKPFKEAMLFFSRIDSQLKALAVPTDSGHSGSSSQEDVDLHDNNIDPQAEDRELKVQLLRKYSGYLGSLKQDFMKKKKNGKLPKEARQQLLDWWSRHYKWPYPSESQKLALAQSTGLDLKQINNWFINQRKRHWKPSDDMPYIVADPVNPHHYMENLMCKPFPMDAMPMLL